MHVSYTHVSYCGSEGKPTWLVIIILMYNIRRWVHVDGGCVYYWYFKGDTVSTWGRNILYIAGMYIYMLSSTCCLLVDIPSNWEMELLKIYAWGDVVIQYFIKKGSVHLGYLIGGEFFTLLWMVYVIYFDLFGNMLYFTFCIVEVLNN